MEKPPSTPDMDARETEEMANSVLLNCPLPNAERNDERLPEGDGSDKLPKEGGDEKLPEETPTGNTVGRVEDVPQKVVSEVQATTSQVSSGSAMPQEKVKLAYKLLGEVLEQESSQPQDNSELNALREQVKKLSSKKAAFQEKIKKLSKAKKDEIEKLKKIKVDSDQEMATILKQLKDLSKYRDLIQQELEELRDVKDAAQDVAGLVEIPEGNEDEPLMLVGRLRKVPENFERDVILEGNVEAEDSSASKSELEKPPSTPDISAQDAEVMANSMLRDSSLPNLERGNEEIPEGDRSGKLPEGGEGKKLSEGGTDEQPEKTPVDSQTTGKAAGRAEDVPKRVVAEVLASTSQEAMGRKGSQTQDEAELNALKERTLSSEKTALEGKLKKLSQSKKG
ncbi:HIV Tat-specific factor 1 homolog [Panicum virgatum]|uniref:HIV Tat-specific factor 1 homolog n=1 Tax=Panicum virgatum TaxID=38727 RepID=UPI0019D6A53B|nr:HIV Tat-specific factor 1 homolog [Panicum virgatum]